MRSLRRIPLVIALCLSHFAFIAPASAALYSFSSHTFTSCGATGQSGPSLASCTSSYSGTNWISSTSNFNVTAGIQSWTVPGTGSYTIDAYGAKGGNAYSTAYTVGQGARALMTVNLTEGHIIKILVGQPGGSFGFTGGGGGGTYVYNQTTSTVIAVAGGGGGGGGDSSNGKNASLTNTGGSGTNSGYAGGTNGAGGNGAPGNGWGSGGAGLTGNGIGAGNATWTFSSGANPLSFTNGGTGAGQGGANTGTTCNGAWGGFGGGGSGACNGGGGGGGYSGGGSGGGGGATYVSGTSTSTSVVSSSTPAKVTISATTPVVMDSTAPVITGPGSATGSTASVSVAENSTAVVTMSANETVTWAISGTDSAFFAIGSSSGVLTISSRNFEDKADANADNIYIVIVTATDAGSNATTQTISVTITNVNEAPSITNNSSLATYAISQAENISSIVTFAGTDVDTPTTLSFSLSGTDASDFQIGSASGVLTFAQNPDFEAPVDSDANNVYIFVVTLSDGSLTDTQTVTLSITDVNEISSAQTPSLSAVPAKGVVVTISLTVNVTSRVMFFVNGKRISTCKVRVTSGSNPNNVATCPWTPSVSGVATITASITPLAAGFSVSTSPPLTVSVTRRTGTR